MGNPETKVYQRDQESKTPHTEEGELKEAKKEYVTKIQDTLNEYHNQITLLQEEDKTYIVVKKIIDSARRASQLPNFPLTLVNWDKTTNYTYFTDKIKENEVKENLIQYIMQGKLWSWEDTTIEETYKKLLKVCPFSSDLKYISDNTWRDIITVIWELEWSKKNNAAINTDKEDWILNAIKKIESIIKKWIDNILIPINEEIINSFPTAVKNLLSKQQTIFTRWRNIVAKGPNWIIEYLWQRIENIYRFFKPFSKIESLGKKVSNNGITMCSATAQWNAKNFWLIIPSGHAKQWVHNPIEDKEHFVESKDKKENNNEYIQIDKAAPLNANFADISVESNTTNGKKYGHRAVAFLDSPSMQWYVLDPYNSWWRWQKPIPLKEYKKQWVVERVNYYNAPIQSQSA